MNVRTRPLQVDVQNKLRGSIPSTVAMRRWLRAAVGRQGQGRSIAVTIVGRAQGRRLNGKWRGKEQATNVLSFPVSKRAVVSPAGGLVRPLGDLVLCAPVIAAEARAQNKPLFDHWAHLLVHGALHLLGHDHQSAAQAQRMERLERRILAEFAISDPYRGTMDLPESR